MPGDKGGAPNSEKVEHMMADEKTLSEEELFLSNGDEPEDPTATEPEPTEPEEVREEPEPDKVEAEPEAVNAEAEPVEGEPEPKPDEKQEAAVPSWRLREINEQKEAIQQQLDQERQKSAHMQAQFQQLQHQLNEMQRKPAPDMFTEPEQWQDHQAQQFQSFQHQMMAQVQEAKAIAMFGADTVETAVQAAIQAEATQPHVAARIQSSPNPFAEAVRWHKEQDVQQQIGEGGIDAFKARVREELMQDADFRKSVLEGMKAQATGSGAARPKPTGTIPSLNGSAPARVQTADGDPTMTEEELFLSS